MKSIVTRRAEHRLFGWSSSFFLPPSRRDDGNALNAGMLEREGQSIVCSGGMACFSFRPPGGDKGGRVMGGLPPSPPASPLSIPLGAPLLLTAAQASRYLSSPLSFAPRSTSARFREASPLRGLPRLSRAQSNGKAFPCLARSELRNLADRLIRGTAEN